MSNEGALRNENHEAYNILDELVKGNQLEPANAEEAKTKFYKLHEALVENMEAEQKLMKKARALQKELSNELLKLEKTQQQQAENEALLKELQNQITEIRKELEVITERKESLKSELAKLDVEKDEIELELKRKTQNEKDRLLPEIEKYKRLIMEMELDIVNNDKVIVKETQNNNDLNKQIDGLESKKDGLREEHEKAMTNYIKIKDEPLRIGKGNENLKIQVNHVQHELDGYKRDQTNYENHIVQEQTVKEKNMQTIQNLNIEIHKREITFQELSSSIKAVTNQTDLILQLNTDIIEKKVIVEAEIQTGTRKKQGLQKNINIMDKDINGQTSKWKKANHENSVIEGNLKEYENQLAGTKRLVEEKQRDSDRLVVETKHLLDEQQIFIGQLVKKGLEDKTMEAKKEKLDKDIAAHKLQVHEFQEEENKWVEEIKFLSTIREKMARTASQAMAQQRETREELKVKELLILDLTKKQQETEFRLNSFIALYEEVKNMRNKYVSQIQNSSQDLAEMKERIKILQNEVEILRSESSEKDRVLADCKKQVQSYIQLRDSHRSELNKKEFTYKNKMSIIGQKINEGDKLNLIINSLQKEMNNLIFKYEMACESRNYMGIQLIDKNDELCILYEKSNIQENILKNGEQEIRQKEEEIRMINLELKERQRQLEVVKKQIPLVPQLAEQVINVKRQLDNEKEKVELLSSQLENPENHPKKRELEGEDADPEALQAKIQVLEERLNNKKESLLEKELVYEEVSNLAEKLRTQALDGRKSTLEIAEKINEYKARTTELSRKMLATVSELSMFQSKALKLQQEKEEKEYLLEQAVQRMENGLAPTDTADFEWEKKMRDKQRKDQDKVERQHRKQLENSLPANGVKTTALPRPNSYMPPDIQIPKPYGSFQPFKPSEPGANMRHITKPKPIEIEY